MDVLWQDTNIFYNVLCFLITENEKLFDRNDSKLYWRTVYHIFGLLHHAYVALFASGLNIKYHSKSEIQQLYTFRLCYLTGWNFMFQTVFLGLALTHDALEWLDKQENSLAQKIRYWRCVIFSGLVFPYTCFVTSMFWVLYWIDRELVFPTVYDEIVPWWFNHCVHTNISIVILIETILHARRQPTDKRMELALNGAVGILYAIVYYTIYFLTHRWLYNVFGILTWWQVCLYQVVIWTSTYVFWLLQFPLNRLFHAAETETEKPAKELTEMPIGVTEKANGDVNVANGVKDAKQNVSEFRNAPFSEKSWSLKYRTIREQFENSL